MCCNQLTAPYLTPLPHSKPYRDTSLSLSASTASSTTTTVTPPLPHASASTSTSGLPPSPEGTLLPSPISCRKKRIELLKSNIPQPEKNYGKKFIISSQLQIIIVVQLKYPRRVCKGTVVVSSSTVNFNTYLTVVCNDCSAILVRD